MGYTIEELSKVRSVLEREGIKYRYKVIDYARQSLGLGTSRRDFGSFGMNRNYEKQYVVSVKRKDSERAKYFIHSILHS